MTMRKGQQIWIRMVILLGLMWISGGCGERALAAPECAEDQECGEGQVCDLGVCISFRSVEEEPVPEDPGAEGEEQGEGESDPVEQGDGDENENEDPSSGGDESGDQNPGPGSGLCTAEFESCDPLSGGHGSFECLPRDDGEGGNCFRRCERSGHADGCSDGQYCWGTGETGPAVCFPSECTAHGDCNGGTCITFDNSYGACIDAGPLAIGESCVGGGTRCQSGLFCDAPTGLAGTCMPVCDPFSETPCASNVSEACSVRWRRSGVCTTYPHLANELRVFRSCSGAGDWCTHGEQCMALGSDNLCMQYCRPGRGDCAGLTLQGRATICDNYWFVGDQSLGLCLPPCSNAGDCGGAYVCVNQICRLPCPSGNPVSDCCEGSLECGYRCEAGYCA